MNPKIFAIFGDPVSHSISPLLHNLTIKNLGLNAVYNRILIKNGNELKEVFNRYRLDAVNVTVPHKRGGILICDEVIGIAKDIKAVNTIVKVDDKLVGFNTDAPGFFESIKNYTFKNALILGAGGTAKALSLILKQNDKDITILNRSKNRLESFKKDGFKVYSWEDFEVDKYDLIINTTSAGMDGSTLPLEKKLLEELLKSSKYAFDVIYNIETPFLKLAKNYAEIQNGKDMLMYQAVFAFNLFFNSKLDQNQIQKQMELVFDL